jgi:hypothetical protein
MIGRLTKQRDILKYLVESIARFPDQVSSIKKKIIMQSATLKYLLYRL